MKSLPAHGSKLSAYDEVCSRVLGLALILMFPLIVPYDAYGGTCAADTAGLFTSLGGTNYSKCVAGKVGIFANILCTFESTMQELLTQIYCSFQTNLKSPIATALSFATVIFGVCVFTGYIKLTVSEALKTVVKLAIVWAFAMNADYGILFVGKFFMGVLQEGSNIAVSPIGGNVTLTQPDSVIQGFFNYMSDPNATALGSTGGPNDCTGMGNDTNDCMNSTMLRNFSSCAAFLMVASVALLVFMPVVLMFILTVLFQYVALYVKAVLGYLTSIVILTFLLIFSPLFLSFALFGVTKSLFSKWLQFLQAFSLQAVILFTFVALLGVVTQGFTVFLYGLMGLMRPYDVSLSFEVFTFDTANACSICEYQITTLPNGIQTIKCLPALDTTKLADATNPSPPRAISATNFPPNPGSAASTATWPNDVSGNAISYYPNRSKMLGDVLSSQTNNMPEDTTQDKGSNYVIPITSILNRSDFIIYIVSNIIAFVVIAHIFQDFIADAPKYAKALAGATNLTLQNGAGGSAEIKYLGADAFKASMVGMEANMLRDPLNAKLNVFTRMREGIMGRKVIADQAALGVTDAEYKKLYDAAPVEGGALGSFFGGAETGGSAYEDRVIAAQMDVAAASRDLKQQQENVVTAGALFENAQAKLEKAKADNASQADIAAKANDLGNKALAYEEALKAADDARANYKRKNKTYKQRVAEMQESGTRLRGAGAQFDENNLVISRGISDDLSLGGNGEIENSRALSRKSARDDAATDEAAAEKQRQAKWANAKAQISQGNYSSLPALRAASSNTPSDMLEANQDTTKQLDKLDNEMKAYGKFLKEDDRKKYQAAMDKARKDLGNAKTTEEIEAIQSNLAGVQDAFDQYSSKNIMQGAALAGIAGVGGLFAMAAQSASSSSLQKAGNTIDSAKSDMNNATNTQDYSYVYNKVNATPALLLNSMTTSLSGQQAMAGRIVPADGMSEIDARQKKVQEAAAAAKTPEEAAQIIRVNSTSSSDILSTMFNSLGIQRDQAAMFVSASNFSDFDKKIQDAQTDADYAQSGDDRIKIMQNLMSAPMALFSGISEGLQQQINDNPDLTPEQRQQMNDRLQDNKARMESAVSGDHIQSVFDDLNNLGSRLNDTMMGVTITKRDENVADDPAYQSQLQKTKDAVAAINANAPSGISGAFSSMKNKWERAQATATPVTWQHHGEVLGSSADDGVGNAVSDFGGRVKAAVPSFSGTQFEGHGEVLGSSADNGVGDAVGDFGSRLKNAAPDFSNTSFEGHGEVLGSSTDNGIPNALGNVKDRLTSTVPDFSDMKFEGHGEVLGSSTDKGIGNAFKDTGDRIEGAAPNFSGLSWQQSANVLGQDVALPSPLTSSAEAGTASATPSNPDGAQQSQSASGSAATASARPRDQIITSQPADYEERRAQTVSMMPANIQQAINPSDTTPSAQPAAEYAANYVSQWDSPDQEKNYAALQAKIDEAKSHYAAVSADMTTKDKAEYDKEFADVSARAADVTSDAEAREVIQQLGIIEASYNKELPAALSNKASQQLQSIEKTLSVAPEMMPAEQVAAIRDVVDGAKRDLASATTPEQFDDVLAKLQEASRMLRA